ncbi:MAG: hypothetical protein U0270_19975 [Labilithrix sp.]
MKGGGQRPDDLGWLGPLSRAIRIHCYRMLGSAHDGDGVAQQTLLRAWRAKDSLPEVHSLFHVPPCW